MGRRRTIRGSWERFATQGQRRLLLFLMPVCSHLTVPLLDITRSDVSLKQGEAQEATTPDRREERYHKYVVWKSGTREKHNQGEGPPQRETARARTQPPVRDIVKERAQAPTNERGPEYLNG